MIEAQIEVNWKTVDEIVKQYRERRPQEYEGAVLYAKQQRALQLTKFGEDGSESNRRHLCELPTYLVMCIETLFPLALKDKNLITFLKRYPQFCIPEKL
jgi:hypothetical protein